MTGTIAPSNENLPPPANDVDPVDSAPDGYESMSDADWDACFCEWAKLTEYAALPERSDDEMLAEWEASASGKDHVTADFCKFKTASGYGWGMIAESLHAALRRLLANPPPEGEGGCEYDNVICHVGAALVSLRRAVAD